VATNVGTPTTNPTPAAPQTPQELSGIEKILKKVDDAMGKK
jgi:hypothetical protein